MLLILHEPLSSRAKEAIAPFPTYLLIIVFFYHWFLLYFANVFSSPVPFLFSRMHWDIMDCFCTGHNNFFGSNRNLFISKRMSKEVGMKNVYFMLKYWVRIFIQSWLSKWSCNAYFLFWVLNTFSTLLNQ